MKSSKLPTLQQTIGYQFSDIGLLQLALSHRSYSSQNNERLEFLGDSILNFVIAEDVFQRFPEGKEGQLSRLRARLVKGQTLAEIAREWGLGDFLLLGSGELKSGGFRRESILADAVEAIIGGIYLDSGMNEARAKVLNWYQSRLQELTLEDTLKDSKTRLQEYLQGRKLDLPKYEVISITGAAHDQRFEVVCTSAINDVPVTGKGGNRKSAEQDAARQILSLIENLKG